jgi:hypothetical protein
MKRTLISKIALFVGGLLVGAVTSAAWLKNRTEDTRGKYITVLEGVTPSRGFTIGEPRWFISGRVTPVIYGDVFNAKYYYLNQWTHERESSEHTPLRVHSVLDLSGPMTCREETGLSSRRWHPRLNGDCYVEDFPSSATANMTALPTQLPWEDTKPTIGWCRDSVDIPGVSHRVNYVVRTWRQRADGTCNASDAPAQGAVVMGDDYRGGPLGCKNIDGSRVWRPRSDGECYGVDLPR